MDTTKFWTKDEKVEAFQRMVRERLCPPIERLYDDDEDIKEHLRHCAFCRENKEGWEGVEVPDFFGLFRPKDTYGNPGEVRGLKWSAVGGDVKDPLDCHWKNPPLVVLLFPLPVGGWRVSQVHDSKELSWTGDIPLSGDMLGSYAESWNCFGANLSDMTPPLASVDGDKLLRLKDLSKGRREIPPLGSAEFAFRKMELSIGSFYGRAFLGKITLPM